MGRIMQIAAFSLAEVTYAVGGEIGFQVQESVKQARFRLKTKQENVSGVFIPAFESYQKEDVNDFALTGLGKGGRQVAKCRETYTRAVEALVELASLQVRLGSRYNWQDRTGWLLTLILPDRIYHPRYSHQGGEQTR